MRLIGHLEDEIHTRRFTDYLYSRGIETHTDPVKNGRWQIWVVEDTNVEAATSLLAQFRQSPDDPAFVEAAKVAGQIKQRAQAAQTPKRAGVVDARTLFYSPPVPVGILSIILILICVIVAAVTELGKNDRFVQPLAISQYQNKGKYIYWDNSLPEVRHGQLWRLVTPMFLHFGILHLLFNMLWLRDLGSMIEARKGAWMLLVLVLVIAAVSNVAQYLYKGPDFGGMSGVVYGLLGYIWMQSRFNPASGLSLLPQTVTMMIIWFFVCLTGMVGPIANTVHAVGFGLGIAWGFLEAQVAVALRRR
jgi:GlpG protein